MRIIGGSSKGRKLAEFDVNSIRPTSDKMRGALFNSLLSQLGTLEDVLFVDAFAGTGAVGLEAISRGALTVLFFENDPEALLLLKENIRLAREERKAHFLGDALVPPRQTPPADVVFLDPPYGKGLVPSALSALLEAGYIGKETIIIAETEKKEKLKLSEEFEIERSKSYGRGALHFIRKV